MFVAAVAGVEHERLAGRQPGRQGGIDVLLADARHWRPQRQHVDLGHSPPPAGGRDRFDGLVAGGAMCCPKCVVDTHLITSSLRPVSVPRSRPVCLEVLYFRSGRTGPNEGGTSNAEASCGCATFCATSDRDICIFGVCCARAIDAKPLIS
jgi:hypothetical protein